MAKEVGYTGARVQPEDGRIAQTVATAMDGRAASVVNAPGVTFRGIECSNISVPDRNGACVRPRAPTITLDDVYFHDFEIGFLGGTPGGVVTIQNSMIERSKPGDRNHGIYVSKGVGQLIFRGNRVLTISGTGYGLKTGAIKSRRKHSMHFRNSINRSASGWLISQSPCSVSGLRGLNGLIFALTR